MLVCWGSEPRNRSFCLPRYLSRCTCCAIAPVRLFRHRSRPIPRVDWQNSLNPCWVAGLASLATDERRTDLADLDRSGYKGCGTATLGTQRKTFDSTKHSDAATLLSIAIDHFRCPLFFLRNNSAQTLCRFEGFTDRLLSVNLPIAKPHPRRTLYKLRLTLQ